MAAQQINVSLFTKYRYILLIILRITFSDIHRFSMLDVACYCTQSRRLSRALTDIYDRALEPSGLTVAQFSLMRTVTRLDTPSIGTLAEATGLDRSTLGRNLKVLQKDGWIALEPGEDGRTRTVGLTKAGVLAIERAIPLWSEAQADIENRLPAPFRNAIKASATALAP